MDEEKPNLKRDIPAIILFGSMLGVGISIAPAWAAALIVSTLWVLLYLEKIHF